MITSINDNLNRLKHLHKPLAIWACVLSLGLSFSIVAGRLYETTSFLSFTPGWVLALIVLFIILTVPFYLLLIRTTCDRKDEKRAEWQPSRKDIWIAIAIMVVPQLVLWLIAWPGI